MTHARSMLVWLAACIVLPMSAQAEFTMAQYFEYRESKDAERQKYVEIFVDGILEGFIAANLMDARAHRGDFFCPPKTLSVDAQTVNVMIDKRFPDPEQRAKFAETPLSIVVLLELQTAYPCHGTAR